MRPIYARETNSLLVIYSVISVVAALVALAGIALHMLVIAYVAPALLQAVPALISTLRFVVSKRNLAHWIAFGGCFLFFHLQLLSPPYWSQFALAISYCSPLARTLSAVGINVFPILVVGLGLLFNRIWPMRERFWTELVNDPRYQRRLFVGFSFIFILAAIPQILYGQVVVGALRQIFYMRSGATESGQSYFTNFSGEGAEASLINVQHFATSLVLLSLLLWRSRYRTVVRMLSPFSVLWAAANVLSGTRTQLLLFCTALVVIYCADPLRKISVRLTLLLPVAVFLLSQFSAQFRDTGLGDFNLKEFEGNFGRVQGLETMYDQTRALDFFIDGYRSPWSTGFAATDCLAGLIYRPVEFALFVIPRSIFPWKPIDPTFEDLNRMVMLSLNLDPNEISWGQTAGIIGRDTLRWGTFGGFVALFWFGFLVYTGDRSYRSGGRSLDGRVLAGAIAGSCIAMYRDLTPLWCLQMFPAVFTILYARGALPRVPMLRRPLGPFRFRRDAGPPAGFRIKP